MIDYVFDEARFKRGEYPYVPCGVWAMSETQFEVGYLDGFDARASEVNEYITGLVEKGIDPVKVEEFMEYARDSRGTRSGSFAEIVDAERHATAVEFVAAWLLVRKR